VGDISEMRGLVVTITFLATLIFLLVLFPQQFYALDYEGRTVDVPEYFETLDVQCFASVWEEKLNETGFKTETSEYYWKDIDIGNHDFDVCYSKANLTHHNLRITHYWTEWVIIPWAYHMDWYNRKGIRRSSIEGGNQGIITGSQINEDFEIEFAEYKVEHAQRFWVRVYIGYNTTLYESINNAWDYYDLHMFVGINFDQTATGYTAWDLIGMLLFWQLPEIHWVIQALISSPFWACVAYLAYIFVLRAIGAIFGGGGA